MEEFWHFAGEVVECAAVFLCGASRAAGAIDESADAAHFEQFVLLGCGDVVENFGQQACTYALFYGLLHTKGVGDGRFLDTDFVAVFYGAGGFGLCTVDAYASVLAGVGCQGARFVDACGPKPFVQTCFHTELFIVVLVHGHVDTGQAEGLDGFGCGLESLVHGEEVFFAEFAKHIVHLTATGKVVAYAKAQAGVFL